MKRRQVPCDIGCGLRILFSLKMMAVSNVSYMSSCYGSGPEDWQENCIHKLLFPLGRKRDMDSSITAKHLQIVMIWLIICIGGQEFLNLIGHFNIIS